MHRGKRRKIPRSVFNEFQEESETADKFRTENREIGRED
tara:strand:- start:2232 stop:2348 length:117 start_codon:yes stop_codon:yes gene_type:complete